jgi:co-chaperonin GroES (HSP10)
MSKYYPFNNMIVVKMPEVAEQTESGIIKSESMLKEEQGANDRYAEVVSVGPNCIQVVVGDKILLRNDSMMHPMQFEGEEHLQTEEYNVLGCMRG